MNFSWVVIEVDLRMGKQDFCSRQQESGPFVYFDPRDCPSPSYQTRSDMGRVRRSVFYVF